MFLLVNKPKGMTSHDVIDRLRRITGERKIGHAGTLDPNATGLLIVGIGRPSTKKLGGISKGSTKSYDAEIVFGEERNTDDVEGKLTRKSSLKPMLSEIKTLLEEFNGECEQIPPQFSAIKVGGKTAYKVARKGGKVELEPRKIMINEILLSGYEYPTLQISLTVSSGTYIRAIARDMGIKLSCFAYLNDLRRTKIGDYSIANSIELDYLSGDNWKDCLIDIT